MYVHRKKEHDKSQTSMYQNRHGKKTKIKNTRKRKVHGKKTWQKYVHGKARPMCSCWPHLMGRHDGTVTHNKELTPRQHTLPVRTVFPAESFPHKRNFLCLLSHRDSKLFSRLVFRLFPLRQFLNAVFYRHHFALPPVYK
jgi:hypothetical protein